MKNKESSAVRIAAFAGYYGDRPEGLDEAIACSPDVLIGDYLAELTMLVLKKNQSRGATGYAVGFIKELERRLPVIAQRKMKLVTNAGGLDPVGCAAAIEALCAKLNLDLRVAAITGDDLLAQGETLRREHGQNFSHLVSGLPLPVGWNEVLTANAYLGAWPIVAALEAGADIVICPRVTDSSLVLGPAAWWHHWKKDDWDKLAGGFAAGHLIECCTQVSGGNYAFFRELESSAMPGMPYADISSAGDFIVGKAPGTGGAVTVDTVKAQLLYEIGGRYYLNPDVVLDLRSLNLAQESEHIVRVTGCRGLPPPPTLKVSLCYDAGYRNSMTVGLTGQNIEAKAKWVEQLVRDRIGDPASFDDFDISMVGPAETGAASYEKNTAWLVVSVADKDKTKVGRSKFSNVLLSSGIAALPGCYFTSPPQEERQIAVQWPCVIEKRLVETRLRIDGEERPIAWGPSGDLPATPQDPVEASIDFSRDRRIERSVGTLFGTRSGDKGGIANLGVWARNDRSWAWLDQWLTVETLKELLPETRALKIDRHRLPNVQALNFLIHDFLGDGVSACLRIDPQAKGLGEYLGARIASFPVSLFDRDDNDVVSLARTA